MAGGFWQLRTGEMAEDTCSIPFLADVNNGTGFQNGSCTGPDSSEYYEISPSDSLVMKRVDSVEVLTPYLIERVNCLCR